MRTATGHHLAHSKYLERDPDDRAAEKALREWDAACCPGCGVHEDDRDERRPGFVPKWFRCRICELVAIAEAAGPPGGKEAKGWHLSLVPASYDD